MRKYAKTLIAVLLAGCVASTAAFALDMGGVEAYPVPFNPDKNDPLRILLPAAPDIVGIIKLNIYDINGDLVFSRNYGSIGAFNWNGRNDSGRKVKPGLYIIKVTAEEATGDYGKKLIRILVDYK